MPQLESNNLIVLPYQDLDESWDTISRHPAVTVFSCSNCFILDAVRRSRTAAFSRPGQIWTALDSSGPQTCHHRVTRRVVVLTADVGDLQSAGLSEHLQHPNHSSSSLPPKPLRPVSKVPHKTSRNTCPHVERPVFQCFLRVLPVHKNTILLRSQTSDRRSSSNAQKHYTLQVVSR